MHCREEEIAPSVLFSNESSSREQPRQNAPVPDELSYNEPPRHNAPISSEQSYREPLRQNAQISNRLQSREPPRQSRASDPTDSAVGTRPRQWFMEDLPPAESFG